MHLSRLNPCRDQREVQAGTITSVMPFERSPRLPLSHRRLQTIESETTLMDVHYVREPRPPIPASDHGRPPLLP